MSMTQEKKSDQAYDLRTLDFQVRRGTITQKEYDQYLKSLPDDEGNFEEVIMKEDEEASVLEDSVDDNDF